jgi:tetratricopeptide (TPR) repeat protein
MNALKNGQLAVSFNLLAQAEKILQRKGIPGSDRLIALTCNNFGCLFKKTGDYAEAIKSFNKAILENKSDMLKKAGSFLNLSNVYSLLVDHEKALSAAKQALEVLNNVEEESSDFQFTLMSALQAVAFELENLSQYFEAEKFYKKALKLVRDKRLGEEAYLKIDERFRILQSKLATLVIDSSRTFDSFKHQRVRTISTPKPKIMAEIKENYSFVDRSVVWNRNNGKVSPVPRHFSKRSEFGYKEKKLGRGKSVQTGKIRPFKGERKKLFILRKGKKKSISKGERIVSKTPEVFPIPYKNKLNLFNTLDNYLYH